MITAKKAMKKIFFKKYVVLIIVDLSPMVFQHNAYIKEAEKGKKISRYF